MHHRDARIALTGLPGNLTTGPLSDSTIHRRIVAPTCTRPTWSLLIHTTLTALREAAQQTQPSTPDAH